MGVLTRATFDPEKVSLAGRVCAVAGASRGIGRAAALAFARAGADLSVFARTASALEAAASEARAGGRRVVLRAGDVARSADVEAWAGVTRSVFGAPGGAPGSGGGVDALLVCASVLGQRVPLAEYPEGDWRRVVDVNLNGAFLALRAFLPLLRPGASVVLVSSAVGRRPAPRWGAYAAAKWGLEGLAAMAAEECAEREIRVNTVDPGGTRTEMRSAAYPDEDPATLPTPEEVVPVFLYLVSDVSRGVTGERLRARDWMPA